MATPTTPCEGGSPPLTLKHAPVDGRLHARDAADFNTLLQAGRLAANAASGAYPHLTSGEQLERAAARPRPGHLVLAHLSALMYSQWDAAESGGLSVFDRALRLLDAAGRAALCAEAFSWGSARLVAPVGEALVVVAHGATGTVVADHTLRKFYRVLGVRGALEAHGIDIAAAATTTTRTSSNSNSNSSPSAQAAGAAGGAAAAAAADAEIEVEPPLQVRLTALPFRGALVCDGVAPGAGLYPPLSAAQRVLVRRNYARARASPDAGGVVTGFGQGAAAVGAVALPAAATLRSVREMDEVSVRVFVQRRGGDSRRGIAAVRRQAEQLRNVPPSLKPVRSVAGDAVLEAVAKSPEEQTLLNEVPPEVFALVKNFGQDLRH